MAAPGAGGSRLFQLLPISKTKRRQGVSERYRAPTEYDDGVTVRDAASAIFESHDPTGRGWSLNLMTPRAVFSAHSVEQVLPTIKMAEDASAAGYWVALIVAYEAAPAFETALVVRAPGDFPLVWAAVFEQSSAGVTHERLPYLAAPWTPQISQADYAKAISRIRSLIESGDTYQVNYTFPLQSSFEGDPFSWFRDLCASQRAGYAAMLDIGRYRVLSISPELFVERRGDRLLTRPMKGTMPRGRWTEEDLEMARTLKESAKNRAENLMIVDLLRSDLGKISEVGSIRAQPLFEAERYETLWQMTSTIESRCRPETSLSSILQALFPCGSITGAPKVRTMQIIRELEPNARGAYTGAIGFIRPGGDFTFNVAIRTIVIEAESGLATFGVGGGITYDSTVAGEYQECLLKAGFLGNRRPEFELLETMLLADGAFPLERHHLSRLTDSAEYFGFQLNNVATVSALEEIRSKWPRGRWKVRLLADRDGRLRTVVEALPEEVLKQPLRVALASAPIDSKDPF
ncbi:MAG: aminodeoxychorismate synthase component I, partial [Acidobacteriota bacterium]